MGIYSMLSRVGINVLKDRCVPIAIIWMFWVIIVKLVVIWVNMLSRYRELVRYCVRRVLRRIEII